jgi:ribose 1,5-bisphosphokinase
VTANANVQQQPVAPEARIGPGRLVLVVGPSGAGKDTLIARVREICRDDSDIVFPQRIVTRPASSAELHDTVSESAFERMRTAGEIALWWQAHGLSYALPRSIDGDVGAGRTVVCNVSRTMVAPARQTYRHVAAVLITAPADLLAARLAQRGRESLNSVAARLRRTDLLSGDLQPDFIIENVGSPDSGARELLAIIHGRTPAIAS